MLLSACLATSLSGCAHSGKGVAVEPLPPVPTHIQTCFNSMFQMPPTKDGWNTEQVVQIIAGLKFSEAKKRSCGKQLIAFYNDVKATYDVIGGSK